MLYLGLGLLETSILSNGRMVLGVFFMLRVLLFFRNLDELSHTATTEGGY